MERLANGGGIRGPPAPRDLGAKPLDMRVVAQGFRLALPDREVGEAHVLEGHDGDDTAPLDRCIR